MAKRAYIGVSERQTVLMCPICGGIDITDRGSMLYCNDCGHGGDDFSETTMNRGVARKVRKIYLGAPKPIPTLGNMEEGDLIQINEGGSPVDFYVAKHDYESGLNGVGRTLVVRKDCYDTRAWHSTRVNAYASSAIDGWFNGNYKGLLDADIQSVIGTTKFYYTPGNGSTSVTTLTRAIFPLSVTELGNLSSGANPFRTEGSALPIASTLQVAGHNGAAVKQWTRTPRTDTTEYVCWLSTSGATGNGACTAINGSRPAFTLPSTLGVFDGLVTGEQSGTLQNIAHRVRRAYIGIGGVARPCFAGGELAYYGRIDNLSSARHNLAAASVGEFALFAGGVGLSSATNVVEAYSKSLTRQDATSLTIERSSLAATTIGDYALFGGGRNSNGFTSQMEAYNSSLSKTYPLSLNASVSGNAATAVGGYAIFGGGYTGSESDPSPRTIVTVYDASLTRSSGTNLSWGGMNLSATTVGNYALFGAGYSDSFPVKTVNAFDGSLTRSTPTDLSSARRSGAATTVGGCALFGGGTYSGASSKSDCRDAVDVYDGSLTRTVAQALTYPRQGLTATTVGGYALFGGGYTTSVRADVDAYDASLTHTIASNLSLARNKLAAATVGDYALFCGGFDPAGVRPHVDAYTIL